MKNLKILSFLLLLIFTASCKERGESTIDDEYAEFRTEPEYITNPTRAQREYFDAYDKVLQHWNVDYEELYIPTSKGTAHVIISGPKSGEPVALLHGMSSSSTMWYPNAKALSGEFRLFAIDLIIEPGKSYKTADFEDLDEVTAWYQEVLWALKLESYHLIGSSRGGWLAVNLALKSKREIRSLVLLSPAQTIIWMRPTSGLLKNIGNIFVSKEKRVDRTISTMSSEPENIDEDFLKQYRIAKKHDTLNKFMMQMQPFSNKDMGKLKMPVLVLIGDEDIMNNKRTLALIDKHMANAKGEVIHESGHFLSVDQPEKVNRKIVDFLKSVEQGRRD